VQEHTDRMMDVQTEIAYAQQSGDTDRVQRLGEQLQQLEIHRQAHLAQAAQNAAQNAGGQPALPPGPPGLSGPAVSSGPQGTPLGVPGGGVGPAQPPPRGGF
jgi:hypothetical protein